MTAITETRPAMRLAGVARGTLSPWRSAAAIRDGLSALWKHRALCRELVRRDLSGQYAGQALGSFWVVGHPLSLLVLYIFVFVVVLKVRIGDSPDMPRDYTNYILAGLVPWLAIQSLLARSSTALIAQANLVKQVVFPIEVLPLGAVIVSMIPMVIGMFAIVAYQAAASFSVPWTVVLAPLFLGGAFLFLGGISFLLSAVTPFFRDVKDVVTVFSTAGVYLIPAFYLPSWVPRLFAPVLHANPFSYPVWVFQDIFYFGQIAHPTAWFVFFALAFASFAIGFRIFRGLRPYIANVL